jgi:hypothetical protein
MSGLANRVCQVLQDYLPAELALIDAEEADGLTTAVILSANYHQWDRTVIPEYPACSIRLVSSTPTPAAGIFPDTFGSQIDAWHRIDVMFHVVASAGPPTDLQALLVRYITGAVRVLFIQKVGLATIADPTDDASWMTWPESAVYGPDELQESGAIVRTATLPIAVRRIEIR